MTTAVGDAAMPGRGGVSASAARLLGEIADTQRAEAGRIAGLMFAAYVEEIGAYGDISDPALRDDVMRVSAALVLAWLGVMGRQDPLRAEELAPLLEGARRRAAQGFDLQSMLRAYRIGIRVMWQQLVGCAEWQSRELQAAVTEVAGWALDFADRVSTQVATAYLEETARRAREREHRRSALLDVVLAGPEADRPEVLAELDTAHVVVVCSVGAAPTLEQLEAAGAQLESGAAATLWTVRHHSVIAVVPVAGGDRAGLSRRLARSLPQAGISAAAIGGRARGPAQTRQSYAEASATLRVGAVVGGQAGPLLDYQELAPLIAMLARPEQAQRFVATALEPLGDLADRPWAVPTLEAYICRQGRLKEAAAALGLHVNTVKYRVAQLRALTGPLLADGERSATLLLALRLRRLLDGAAQG